MSTLQTNIISPVSGTTISTGTGIGIAVSRDVILRSTLKVDGNTTINAGLNAAGTCTIPSCVAKGQIIISGATVGAMTCAVGPSLPEHLARKDYVDVYGLGLGQTWKNLVTTRVINQLYTNNSPEPIMVCISFSSGTDAANPASVVVDGVVIATATSDNAPFPVTFIVPVGSTYILNTPLAQATVFAWSELSR